MHSIDTQNGSIGTMLMNLLIISLFFQILLFLLGAGSDAVFREEKLQTKGK